MARAPMLVLALLLAAGTPLAKGRWGGDHVALEITHRGAEIDYDCARGRIDEPIAPDADGHFSAKGVHVRERGGPIRKDETRAETPATFTGQVKGDTMTLTVTLEGGVDAGTFSLRRGAAGRVFKCR
jgi:hypothetical protein